MKNPDIARGRKIAIDEDSVLRNLVDQRRGAFCYELNGACAALLLTLGFRVTLLSARVARPDGGEGTEFDPPTLRVALEQPWLVDVGFGESFLEPLLMEAGREQTDPVGTFRLVQLGEGLLWEKAGPEAGWKPQYSLSLQRRRLEEFAGMCRYHQTSPESSFT